MDRREMLDVTRLPKAEFHLHFEATLGWPGFARMACLGGAGPGCQSRSSEPSSFEKIRVKIRPSAR